VVNINPLVIPILEILKSRCQMSEHQLMKQLECQGAFDLDSSRDRVKGLGHQQSASLQLFHRHFLIMNALYQLQEQLLLDGFCLQVSPLSILLSPLKQQDVSALSIQDESPALKAYYSDLANLEETGEQEVEGLLNAFWQRYVASDKRLEAYQLLELPVESSWQEVKLAYRRLAKLYHPDHGGSQEKFVELRNAFEVIRASRF
jgi:DnaJ-domain-containing protein 1